MKQRLMDIEKFIQKHDKVNGIYIALEKESTKVNTFAKKLGLSTPILLDKFEVFAKKHGVIKEDGVVSLPKTFLIDQKGNVVDIVVLEGDDFETLLKNRLLGDGEATK